MARRNPKRYPYWKYGKVRKRPAGLYRRRRRTRGRKRRLPLTGMPHSKMVKLRYCQEITLNPTSVAPAVNNFRANDMYDPDFTGGGHQPSGFDQLMAWYDHFTVVGSKISMKFIPTTAGNLVPGYFGVALTDAIGRVGALAGAESILESRICGRSYSVGGSYNSVDNKSPTVYKSFSARKFFSKSAIVGEKEYKGSTAASPTEEAIFECWAASAGLNDPSALTFLITIDYIAVLSEPKSITPS